MQEETLQLSELEREAPQIQSFRPEDFFTAGDSLDPIRGNTRIEDAITNTPGAFENQSLSQRIQLLNDLNNEFDLVDRQFKSAEQDIVSNQLGRGITAIGRKADVLTRQRQLDARRQALLGNIEFLRGNIETSNRLSNLSSSLSQTNDSVGDAFSDDGDVVFTDEEIEAGATEGKKERTRRENRRRERDRLNLVKAVLDVRPDLYSVATEMNLEEIVQLFNEVRGEAEIGLNREDFQEFDRPRRTIRSFNRAFDFIPEEGELDSLEEVNRDIDDAVVGEPEDRSNGLVNFDL